jgi:hypothetical protein
MVVGDMQVRRPIEKRAQLLGGIGQCRVTAVNNDASGFHGWSLFLCCFRVHRFTPCQWRQQKHRKRGQATFSRVPASHNVLNKGAKK